MDDRDGPTDHIVSDTGKGKVHTGIKQEGVVLQGPPWTSRSMVM